MALGRVGPLRLVTLDALGTLVELLAPVPRLVAALAARGVAATEAQAGAAMRAEIAHYRAHLQTAVDEPSLQALRGDCARLLGAALTEAGAELGGLDEDALRGALLEALRFAPYPEVPAALAALRAAGLRLVVASNWDVSLHEMLRATGLRELVDGAVSSAEVGAAKPAAAVFARALELGAAPAGDALHVGDSPLEDVDGALRAGLRAVLVVRAGPPPRLPPGVAQIASLDGLVALAA